MYEIPIPKGFKVHNQGNKMNCTSHAITGGIEIQLGNKLGEAIYCDVDDLWEKQKKFGTATEEEGEYMENAWRIAATYGIKFKTFCGKTGTIYPSAKSLITIADLT